MPKPSRGKTETIKQRAIYVYLPSLEMVEDWKRKAERAGVSLSRFLYEWVEDAIRRDKGKRAASAASNLSERLRR